ncbi:sigma-70 family RNA polymerase sigma factor [Mucisphaera calidilacus]|uniref:RNA polymerase sigma factor RpoD n=1 Tax=Mucisphaera calidilacus TaxID=2527982 RepID=A0A518BTQ2_9BACT|nr:sigma-70 family RNA polymerase sigma factor [Mucisphaera calidilacus]QDU70339.1 RNA polymerase sigma factor RpoD [Mucisphaera calidilacus]
MGTTSASLETRTRLTNEWTLPEGLSEEGRERLGELLPEPIDFMASDLFNDDLAIKALLAEAEAIPRASVDWYYHLERDTPVLQMNQASEPQLLTPAQERVIFVAFNYCRFRAEEVRSSIKTRRVGARQAEALLDWDARAMRLREFIAEYNVALVLAMARKFERSRLDFSEMIAEGNLALIRSIEKFDVSRGFKFSTYACRSILKAFSRLGEKTSRYRRLFPVEANPDYERSDHAERKAEEQREDCTEQVARLVDHDASGLTSLEREVVRQRFGLDGANEGQAMTLLQVGQKIGMTKERVRQIQNRALRKLRSSLEETFLDGHVDLSMPFVQPALVNA